MQILNKYAHKSGTILISIKCNARYAGGNYPQQWDDKIVSTFINF